MERVVSAAQARRKERKDSESDSFANELKLETGGSEPEPSAETEGQPETEAKPEPARQNQSPRARVEAKAAAEVEGLAEVEAETKVEAATAGEAIPLSQGSITAGKATLAALMKALAPSGQADGEAEAVGEAETKLDEEEEEEEEEKIADMHHHALNAAASRMHHSANNGPYKDTHKTLEALSDSVQKLHEYEEHMLTSLPMGIQADASAILAAFNITAARRRSTKTILRSTNDAVSRDAAAVRLLLRAKRMCTRGLDLNPECWPALWFEEPWTLKPFRRRSLYFISDYPYKIH
jgi:hypothetical protein